MVCFAGLLSLLLMLRFVRLFVGCVDCLFCYFGATLVCFRWLFSCWFVYFRFKFWFGVLVGTDLRCFI